MKGIIWQNLIKSSEARRTLNNSQVGGCTRCNTNTLTQMEKLKTDISWCSRKALISFDNNAALCYDRIVPNLASLIERKKGSHLYT
eukprot:4025842-Ditylum_brightwellii.AAC.1